MSQILPNAPAALPVTARLQITLALTAGRILARARPDRLRRLLGVMARGAEPAGYDEARHARDQLLTASAACRGGSACLLRSLAVASLCRLRGTWPTWAVGVLAIPPFAAHAWVEADGRIVDEPLGHEDYRAFFKVSGSERSR